MLSKTVRYLIGYSAISVGLISWSIHDSLTQSYNFTMFIVEMTDGIKLGILLNFIIFSFMIIMKLLQLIIFGELRIIELEHLFETLPFFIINLFLNLATGDNNIILNVLLMGFAISFKIFHILIFDRLDFLNLTIVNHLMTQDLTFMDALSVYLSSISFWLNLIFIGLDFAMAKFLIYDVFQGINSVTCLLFGFQFAVQGVEALTNYSKLLLGIYETLFYRIDKSPNMMSVRFPMDGPMEINGIPIEGTYPFPQPTPNTTEPEEDDAEDSESDQATLNEEDEEDEDMPEPQAPDPNLEFNFEDDDDDDDDEDQEKIWENKAYYTKAVDICAAILTSVSYIVFIYLLTFHSGSQLPLSMLQGTYSSIRKSYLEIKQLLLFIESSKRLDAQLPNATTEDLEQADNLCIICRETMHTPYDFIQLHHRPQPQRRCPKKLGCGHILHVGCLKEWLERSDSCPLCRRKVFLSEAEARAAAIAAANQPHPEPAQAQNPPVEVPEPPQAQPGNIPVPPPQTADIPQPTTVPIQQQQPSNIDHLNEVTTAPPVEGTSTQLTTSGEPNTQSTTCQTISLPHNALLPPGWILLPLEKPNPSAEGECEGDYKVSLSKIHSATLRIRRNTESGRAMIRTYELPREVIN
ncbi:HRD1 [[Candida] subhashii]|uniref:RING-type E3 ubiquitin transferase n=1 Tax=[Candida] subhashii TaxID=561895 RepID=A0A8J5QCM4_9ASCO|nr:HRD1 [[Candida] subhashii]KAG7661002.1 HRD1 [[Candida] subhashii]